MTSVETEPVIPVYSGGEPRAARTWAVGTTSGVRVTGCLPEWAGEDPSASDVAPDCLDVVLADIVHQASRGGLVLPVTRAQDLAQEAGVLVVTIDWAPFRGAGDGGVPVVNVQVVDDVWLKNLDPAGVAEFGRRLRSLADLLTGPVAVELAAVRADWADRHAALADTPC